MERMAVIRYQHMLYPRIRVCDLEVIVWAIPAGRIECFGTSVLENQRQPTYYW
jgi:hypothetical protein